MQLPVMDWLQEDEFSRNRFRKTGIRSMAMHEQIESMVDGFSEPVDAAAAFVTEWWENADGRRLPGEEGGFTVYAIEFWDRCRFFDYTQDGVFERVSELGFGPVEVWRNNFVSEHMGQMAYVVRCVASDLAVTDALELVTRLVVAAPRGMELWGRGVLEHPECFLGDHAPEPVTMTFAEWAETWKAADTGGSPSSNIP